MRIYLVGYMGSGKSTIGKQLAEGLEMEFLDLDSYFEKHYRISVHDFFEKYDEQGFRIIEQNLLHETASYENVLVSTGGGTPCFFDNMDFIKKSGISVYLFWPLPVLVERLKHLKKRRPLLKDLPAEELYDKVKQQMEEREFYYRQADIVVDTERYDPVSLISILKTKLNQT